MILCILIHTYSTFIQILTKIVLIFTAKNIGYFSNFIFYLECAVPDYIDPHRAGRLCPAVSRSNLLISAQYLYQVYCLGNPQKKVPPLVVRLLRGKKELF